MNRISCLLTLAGGLLLSGASPAFSFGAEIQGPESIKVGHLLVLEAVGVTEGTSRWIVPDAYSKRALRTATKVALIPTAPGQIEILLVTSTGEEIGFARHAVDVTLVEVPKGPPKVAEVVVHPPTKLDVPRKTAKVTDDPRPMVVMYSMPASMGECEPCERWKREEYNDMRGWTYAEEKSGNGIKAFPSFEVRANGHSQFVEGFQTSEQLKAIAKNLEALD